MNTALHAYAHRWKLREPFVIARGVSTTADVVVVRLSRRGDTGHGEAAGVPYLGETVASMLAQIETLRPAIEAGVNRHDLLHLLPPGGARNAIDAAIWDLEAKCSGISAWRSAGVEARPVITNVTIGIRSIAAAGERAAELADHPWIKVKVAADAIIPTVEAVRRNAPHARLVVDANQAWTMTTLHAVVDHLHRLGVDLIEQPLPAGADEGLSGYRGPVPLCADESLSQAADLAKLTGRYQYVNIKLDKTGGLTAGLALAGQAQAAGFQLMVGCMLGSSLAMAPAMVLAQRCQIVDLDGPLLQAQDCEHGIVYERGLMTPPSAALWG